MKLVFLGTTGYHPNDQRHTACLMVPEAGLVFDAGTAMFRLPEYIKTTELDLFLTHAHLDHIIGLTFLHGVLYGHEIVRLTIHGQAAKLDAIDEHLFSEDLFPVKLPWEFRPLRTTEVHIGGQGVLTHFPVDHPGGAVGYRVDWPDRSLAYVTDTTAKPGADYIKNIRGVDLLVHECYFPDSMQEWAEKTGHSTTTPVAQVAEEAEVGRLVLVHTNPAVTDPDPIDIEVARAIFPNTELAADRQEIEF